MRSIERFVKNQKKMLMNIAYTPFQGFVFYFKDETLELSLSMTGKKDSTVS